MIGLTAVCGAYSFICMCIFTVLVLYRNIFPAKSFNKSFINLKPTVLRSGKAGIMATVTGFPMTTNVL